MSTPFIELKANMSPLVIVREFGRDIPLACDGCGRVWPMRLYSDTILDDQQCNELLDNYLLEHGWTLAGDRELCPQCAPGGYIVEAAGVKPALERQPPSATGKGGP